MSNPICPPAGTRHHLGCDGSNSFYLIGSEVYRTDGIYWRWYSSLRGWPSCSTARRIARRQSEDEARRQCAREQAIVAAERARLGRRR
jgi:hypothetical protein